MKRAYRYIIYFLIVVIVAAGVLLLTMPDAVPAISESDTLIVIDAGHGGFDSGAIGRFSGVHEDGLNLSVAQKLEVLFEGAGFEVIMTRGDDEAVGMTKDDDMWTRRKIIDEADADIVISVHMNKFSQSSVSGPMVFYFDDSAEGEKLAAAIQQMLNDTLQPPRPRTHKPETYYILRSGTCPCALVECGFLSNEREEWLLQTDDYQQKCADAIFSGAVLYLETRFVTDITEDIDQ